jgi:hypothetical protein
LPSREPQPNNQAMAPRFMRRALRHRRAVTVVLVAILLLNVTVVGQVDPPPLDAGTLPLAARCQGGGADCAEQPLIPPPAIGLPHMDALPLPAFGTPAAVAAAPLDAIHEAPPQAIEHPPSLLAA